MMSCAKNPSVLVFLKSAMTALFEACLHILNINILWAATGAKLLERITSKVVVIRAKAKMHNILSRKSLEMAKQIQPCCLTYYTTNQLGTSPTIFSTTKTFREHLKIVSNTKNQRGAPKS